MRYLGLDLAWGGTTGSGCCVLDADGTLLDEAWLPADALGPWLAERRGARSLLAIDAPLVVPDDGRVVRDAERALHRRYGRLHAGPFPGGSGSTGAARLKAAIATLPETDPDPWSVGPHRALEVFPAPTWIELFGLSERIRYKPLRGQAQVTELARLLDLLDRLADRDPPLRVGRDHDLRARLAQARGTRQRKQVEDLVDARLCAYVGLAWDRAGRPDAWVVRGTGAWSDGYVIVPAPLPSTIDRP
jgi:predicted RNase H-like nuclease